MALIQMRHHASTWLTPLAQATLALSRGARADAGDEGFFGWSALHRAADKGCDGVAAVLVHYGATVDRPEAARGLTALHLAAHQGRFEAAQVLLNAGADPRRPDAGGATALELAQANAWRSPRHRDLEVTRKGSWRRMTRAEATPS